MSVSRAFAQRNTNVTKLVPKFESFLPDSPPLTNCALYSLSLPSVHYTGGIFYVDMSDIDMSGDVLNYSGKLNTFNNNNCSINAIAFVLNNSETAPIYPGLDFTIFFKNIPTDRINNEFSIPFTTICIINNIEMASIPYIFCPPLPSLFGTNVSSSITLKSDGTAYNVASSGPAGWLGIAAILSILEVTCNINL